MSLHVVKKILAPGKCTEINHLISCIAADAPFTIYAPLKCATGIYFPNFHPTDRFLSNRFRKEKKKKLRSLYIVTVYVYLLYRTSGWPSLWWAVTYDITQRLDRTEPRTL